MACNTCAKTFSIFRPEKGCPSCGFSYCSKCLKYKVYLKKLNSQVIVCTKCNQISNSTESKNVTPPDAYYKRIGITEGSKDDRPSENAVEVEISDRLKKLKEETKDGNNVGNTSNEIADRLQKLKGETPSTSDAELRLKLANIKGVPVNLLETKQSPATIQPKKTEQEQIDELMQQYMAQGSIDKKYEDEFDGLVSDIESRLKKLKGTKSSDQDKVMSHENNDDSEDEEETIKKIIEKVTAEAQLGDTDIDPVMDELPFCEICNEDAKMRCLGCKYLFCKTCFKDHKDSDDGCDKYENYSPPKNFVM